MNRDSRAVIKRGGTSRVKRALLLLSPWLPFFSVVDKSARSLAQSFSYTENATIGKFLIRWYQFSISLSMNSNDLEIGSLVWKVSCNDHHPRLNVYFHSGLSFLLRGFQIFESICISASWLPPSPLTLSVYDLRAIYKTGHFHLATEKRPEIGGIVRAN